MTALRVITSEGAPATLEEATVQSFADSLRGRLLQRGDDGYDEARKLFNGMIDRRPALIAQCLGAADIAAAVRFAREHNLIVSIKGGGHSVTGNAVCHGGLMIDPSRMKSIRVDPAQQIVRAEPGVLGGELDRETQAFGLSTPVGSVSSTGISGLTLGGGQSWLASKHGLAIDNRSRPGCGLVASSAWCRLRKTPISFGHSKRSVSPRLGAPPIPIRSRR
jgi:hypothetical protein